MQVNVNVVDFVIGPVTRFDPFHTVLVVADPTHVVSHATPDKTDAGFEVMLHVVAGPSFVSPQFNFTVLPERTRAGGVIYSGVGAVGT